MFEHLPAALNRHSMSSCSIVMLISICTLLPPLVSDEEEGSGEQGKVPEAKEGRPVEGASTIYCVGTEVSHYQ